MNPIILTYSLRAAAALVMAFGTLSGAFAQPDTPAVTREYSLFVGDLRANAISLPVSYFGGTLQGDATSRPFSLFGGSLQHDAWWREVSVDVGSCMEPQQPPTITQHPQPVSSCPGGDVSFSTEATGEGRVVYLWQAELPPIGSGTWLDLADGPLPPPFVTIATASGAATPTLSLRAVDPGAETRYRVIVSNACGSDTSLPAALAFDSGEPPLILVQPVSQTICPSGPARFNVVVANPSPLTNEYHWEFLDTTGCTGHPPGTWVYTNDGCCANCGPGGVGPQWMYNGGKGPNLTIMPLPGNRLTSANVGRYRLLIINGCGRTRSNEVELILCPADFSCDGVVNSQDFFAFLTAFFTGEADFNMDGITNSQDFFDFLNAFFAGCS